MESAADFLNEAWGRKAKAEQGEVEIEKPFNYEQDKQSFLTLEHLVRDPGEGVSVEAREQLTRAYEDLLGKIERYHQSILRFDHLKQKDLIDKEEMSRVDGERRRHHNTLIDSLNILSRLMKRLGLDNNWRRDIGIRREEVQRWAQNTVYYLQQKGKESRAT